MKIAVLAFANSIHTLRWVNALVQHDLEIHLFSQHPAGDTLDKRVHYHPLPVQNPTGYFFNHVALRRALHALKVDLLHVHYATGYGSLGRLCGFKPMLLSVWGSDVYTFPHTSPLHAWLIRANLNAATALASTSMDMANTTQALCGRKDIHVTPFGVDLQQFSPKPQQDPCYITIGTVKALTPTYGIDILIRAFHALRQTLQTDNPTLAAQLRLHIAGDGCAKKTLETLVDSLEIRDCSLFSGRIEHQDVPAYLNHLDIYAAPSRVESFGVAVLEASACGLPVVVSKIGGLPEVVENKVSGLMIDSENVVQLTRALRQLVESTHLRQTLGQNGRKLAEQRYDWNNNVLDMLEIYQNLSLKNTR